MRVWAAAGVAMVVGVGTAACGGSSGPQRSASAEVYIATVREVVRELPPAPTGDGPLPVIYVLSSNGETIHAGVQAEVASAVDAEVDLRFADTRSEAVDEEKAGAPVHDGGHLLVVGPVDDEDGRVDLEYELYRSDREWSRRVVTFDQADDGWSPTSSSVLEEQDVPPSTGDTAGPDDTEGAAGTSEAAGTSPPPAASTGP